MLAREPQTAFISYSREDSEFALRLAGDLKAAGAAVWLDQLDIAPGERWARAVENALNSCPRLLVILSPASVGSKNVEDEVAFALEEGKPVIPVLCRDCRIPFRLRSLHYADFRSDYARGLKELTRTLAPLSGSASNRTAVSGAPVGQKQESRKNEGSSEGKGGAIPVESRATWAAPAASPDSLLSRWIRLGTGTKTALHSVAFPTAELGWAVGAEGIILHTSDCGDSWRRQTSGVTRDLRSVAFATAQLGWAVGEGGVILHTADGGQIWMRQECPSFSSLYSVAFPTFERGCAVGGSRVVVHTQDGGRTWRPSSGLPSALTSVVFVTPESGWAVGTRGTIVHTRDGGVTWEKQTSGHNGALHSVSFASGELGWAVGDGGVILHTHDAGMTWKSLDSEISDALIDVSFPTAEMGWAVGVDGVILRTENGGKTWGKRMTGSHEDLRSVYFPTQQCGWTVGDYGTILRWRAKTAE